MKNKTLKAVVAALTLASGPMFASSSAPEEVHQGCCVIPMTSGQCTGTKAGGTICPVSCKSHGGFGCPPKGEVISGTSTNKETLANNMWPVEATTGRARGDVVRFDLSGVKAMKLSASGTIQLPQVGSFNLYELPFTPVEAKAIAAYGKLPADQRVIRIVFGSFNLENADANAKSMLSPQMKKIIADAKKSNPNAKSMVWVGRLLPKETQVTELASQASNDLDLSKAAPLSYRTTADGSAQVDLPAIKDAEGNVVKGEAITIDLAAVK